MTYLIYNTKQDAIDRAEQEGIARNLPYHTGKGTSRYLTYPSPTADGKWALDVSGYDLTEDEAEAVVETFEAPEQEDTL
jgi:hypothetical protein